jgi:hypothetical protein
MQHARSSPPDRYHQVGQLSPPVAAGNSADCLTYFWKLAKAKSLNDFDYLWADFGRRSRELASLAGADDVRAMLYHLTMAVKQSALLRQWHSEAARAAILDAISTAATVSWVRRPDTPPQSAPDHGE